MELLLVTINVSEKILLAENVDDVTFAQELYMVVGPTQGFCTFLGVFDHVEDIPKINDVACGHLPLRTMGRVPPVNVNSVGFEFPHVVPLAAAVIEYGVGSIEIAVPGENLHRRGEFVAVNGGIVTLDVVAWSGIGEVLAVRNLLQLQTTADIKGISLDADQLLPIPLEADGAGIFIQPCCIAFVSDGLEQDTARIVLRGFNS